VPVDLGLQMHEHRAEADRGAIHEHELARRGHAADLAQAALHVERDLTAIGARVGLLDQPRTVLHQRRVHEHGPEVEGVDHLLAQVGEPPGLVGVHRERHVAAHKRPVKVDHALDQGRPEHADAAEVQEVEAHPG
jgi:hypothetical protein